MVWFCHKCQTSLVAPENQKQCPECGEVWFQDAPKQTRKPKAQREPPTHFSQTLDRIAHDLGRGDFDASEKSSTDPSGAGSST